MKGTDIGYDDDIGNCDMINEWGNGNEGNFQRSEFSGCWLKENCPSPSITDPGVANTYKSEIELSERVKASQINLNLNI